MRKICITSPLLLLLVFSLCGHASSNFKVYAGSNAMTWKNAQAFCREHHTDLITMENEYEAQPYYSIFGWVGLYRDDADSPWKWSIGDAEAKYINWAIGEPHVHEHCALKQAYGTQLYNYDCEKKFPFICNDATLVLVKENKTWEEALDHCRSLGKTDTNSPASSYGSHRYDLVTIISEADQDDVQREAQKATTDEVWTGLRFLAGEWLWVSGEELKYDNLQRCEADRFCGVLEKKNTSSFGTRSCSERRNFFCQKRL